MAPTKPNPSKWTEQRLQRLFAIYKRRYWKGYLPDVRVCVAELDCYGRWHPKQREIRIDAPKHHNDRELRATLLHEMCHVAAGTGDHCGHGLKFWAQIERLLRQKAPITIGFPEAPEVGAFLHDTVPKQFPLARRLMNRADEKRQREVERRTRHLNAYVEVITDPQIVEAFAEPTIVQSTWRTALLQVGSEYGLLNVDGRPKNRWAAKIVEQGRNVHRRARREAFDEERFWRSALKK